MARDHGVAGPKQKEKKSKKKQSKIKLYPKNDGSHEGFIFNSDDDITAKGFG